MQDRQKTIDRFDTLFGWGWKKAYAKALELDATTLTRFSGSTLKHAKALASFFEATPPTHWPEMFSELRAMHETKMKGNTA